VPVVRPKEEEIKQKMVETFEASFHSYGKRRLVIDLKKSSFKIGVLKTARLMKTLGLVAKRPKKPHYYTIGKEQPTTPHLLKRAFNPSDLNTRWVGDITYIRSHQGWSYLATVMDLANREIVGYAISKTPDAQLAKKALTNAIAKHQPNTKWLMFHSNQGVQYNAKLFKETLENHKMIQSMSRRGCCWDNAVKSVFSVT
jgi:putative transposase